MSVFKYADEESKPKEEEEENEDTKAPAPSEAGNNTYEEGEAGTSESVEQSTTVTRGTPASRF